MAIPARKGGDRPAPESIGDPDTAYGLAWRFLSDRTTAGGTVRRGIVLIMLGFVAACGVAFFVSSKWPGALAWLAGRDDSMRAEHEQLVAAVRRAMDRAGMGLPADAPPSMIQNGVATLQQRQQESEEIVAMVRSGLSQRGSPIPDNAPLAIYQERFADLQQRAVSAFALRGQLERGRDALEPALAAAGITVQPDPPDTMLVRAVAALQDYWSVRNRDAAAENTRLRSAAEDVAARLRDARKSVDPGRAPTATPLEDIDALSRLSRVVPNSPNMQRFVGLINAHRPFADAADERTLEQTLTLRAESQEIFSVDLREIQEPKMPGYPAVCVVEPRGAFSLIQGTFGTGSVEQIAIPSTFSAHIVTFAADGRPQYLIVVAVSRANPSGHRCTLRLSAWTYPTD
jgi:hypothetical protein